MSTSCLLCGSIGTNGSTCPLNYKTSRNPDFLKHYLVQKGGVPPTKSAVTRAFFVLQEEEQKRKKKEKKAKEASKRPKNLVRSLTPEYAFDWELMPEAKDKEAQK